jgi:hypothetical protein
VIQTATNASASELQKAANWAGANYAVVRTSPAEQCYDDLLSSGDPFWGFPTLPLIDMSTMTVLVPNCFNYPTDEAADYEACVEDHL